MLKSTFSWLNQSTQIFSKKTQVKCDKSTIANTKFQEVTLNQFIAPKVTSSINVSRRGILHLFSAGAGVALGSELNARSHMGISGALASTPEKCKQDLEFDHLALDDMIVHGKSPLTIETKRHKLGTSVITHETRLYIRNNLPLPSREIVKDPDQWTITVDGVQNSQTLTVETLKTLGLHTVASVLQCSGNGRAFYTHEPSGSKWSTGAAGCVLWSGVKVVDVVNYLDGLVGTPRYLTSTGADPLPQGIDPMSVIVERSIPVEKALKDALLAWEMNGEPISLEHGGPLRLIVPGYFGCNQIKYVKTLKFTNEQTKAKIQHSGYRMRPIGEKGNPSQPTMWEMPLKSWVTNEIDLYGNSQIIKGVALGGERPVSRVDVSIDGGITWQRAQFVGPDLGPFAWRLFQLKVDLQPGRYYLTSRAYNDLGEVQTETRTENERGYGHNGWKDHILKVNVYPKRTRDTISYNSKRLKDNHSNQSNNLHKSIQTSDHDKEEVIELSDQARRGREIYLHETKPQCGVCHQLDDAKTVGNVGPYLDLLKPTINQVKHAVSKGVGAMPAQTQLTPQQIDDLAQYIFEVTRR